jgi:hypothetical protein
MKRIYICFGGTAYDDTTAKIVDYGPQLGADEVKVYDDRWLMGTDFYAANKWLWTYPASDAPNRKPRGFGWFCWKPYVILDALSRAEDGDIVLYTDADTYPVANFSALFEECPRAGGVMLFAAQGCFNRQWVKRDCWITMGMDDPKWYDTQAGVARFMLFQKGAPLTDQFLREWQAYCLDLRCQTFEPSVLGPELEGFKEHRCEQAIMTLLALRHGLKFYREACQFGDGSETDRGIYPTLFHQVYCSRAKTLEGSRFRNVEVAA